MKALQRLHAPAATVMPERIWTQLFIRRFDPAEAAELAEREYRSTRPADWIKVGEPIGGPLTQAQALD